ncbi:HEPN domain-containing protein [Sphingomonas hankookensis]
MPLEKTKFAFEEISSHIQNTTQNPLLQSYFVQYLLVAFYSEMEHSIKLLIQERLSNIEDYKVSSFVYKSSEGMIRRVKKAEINDLLRIFGCGEGDLIGEKCGDTNLQPYFDAITNRHLVSHSDGVTMTLDDFSKVLPCADLILEKVREILWE